MSKKHVTLLVETSTTWGREIVHGVGDYANKYADWLVYFEPRGKYEDLKLPADWKGDGIIARVTHKALAEQVVASGKPAVNVSWYDFESNKIQHCSTDEVQAGQLVAQHFLGRAFCNFAYCGPRRRADYNDLFGDAYVSVLQEEGFECDRFHEDLGSEGGAPTKADIEDLAQWIGDLSKPVAILAFSSVRGRQVVDACRLAGASVPEEVAVLGGELDELSCDLSNPKLSSVDLAPYRVGWEAANLLAEMMDKGSEPRTRVLVPPARIVVRHSTDTLAIDDEVVSTALKYITANASSPITVKDILKEVPTSRRLLEVKFRKLLGRTIGQEIRHVRIELAKQLLADTEYPLATIADRCGLPYGEMLTRLFRREVGMTPSSYRKLFRPRAKIRFE